MEKTQIMKKKCKKILSVKIMSVPLHPQIAKAVLLDVYQRLVPSSIG